MRHFGFVFLVACWSSAPAPHQVSRQRHVDLIADADRLFARSLGVGDVAPPHVLGRSYRAAQQRYREACAAGLARGCWMSKGMRKALDEPPGGENQQMLVLCRGGELMACRALQQEEAMLQPGDPGHAGSAGACGTIYEPSCDLQTLEVECAAGFVRSCSLVHDSAELSPRGARQARITDLGARRDRLGREGCRQGILHECDRATPEGYSQVCQIALGSCFSEPPVGVANQHALAIRACTIGGRSPCLSLAFLYAYGRLPQPAPGRARELVDRFCTSDDIANLESPCNELEDARDRLQQLP